MTKKGLKKVVITVSVLFSLLLISCSMPSFSNFDTMGVETDGGQTYATSNSITTDKADTTVELVDSIQAQQIYKNVRYISEESFQTQNIHEPQEGLTILYGSDLDTQTIAKFVHSEAIGNKTLGATKMMDNVMSTDDDFTNVYMVMRYIYQDTMDVKYVSVSYDAEVDENIVENYVSSKLALDAMSQQAISFINDEITDEMSALNRSNSTRLSTGDVRVRATDYNTYMDVFPFSVIECPLIVYAKTITYDAIYVPDSLEDSESYIILARVFIEPGNSYDPESADMYNDEFGDYIVIRGAKTEFHNLFGGTGGDRFIDMVPTNDVSNISGQTQNYTIEFGADSISISFNLQAPNSASIEMDTYFDYDGISYVEFMAGGKNAIDTDQFYYQTAIYMESVGTTLYTRAATGVTFCYRNPSYPGEKTADEFAGSGRELYYEGE